MLHMTRKDGFQFEQKCTSQYEQIWTMANITNEKNGIIKKKSAYCIAKIIVKCVYNIVFFFQMYTFLQDIQYILK